MCVCLSAPSHQSVQLQQHYIPIMSHHHSTTCYNTTFTTIPSRTPSHLTHTYCNTPPHRKDHHPSFCSISAPISPVYLFLLLPTPASHLSPVQHMKGRVVRVHSRIAAWGRSNSFPQAASQRHGETFIGWRD